MAQAFREIREAARRNDDILGFVVTGSRGKGFANQWSDYDFAIFVRDDALEKYREKYRELPPDGRLYIFTPSWKRSFASTTGAWYLTTNISAGNWKPIPCTNTFAKLWWTKVGLRVMYSP